MEVEGETGLDELQVKVRCLHAGDEKYAGQWLAAFQRKDEAWQLCVKALSTGPEDKSCDEELLHGFCAQTLARLSRGFASRHPLTSQGTVRAELEWLLNLHAFGQKLVWKQLALALVSADLWLGRWSAGLQASYPDALKQELLVLPTELLFSGRPLPLDSAHLRQRAAEGLLDACAVVFPALLNLNGNAELDASKVLAAWLRAARKSLQWMPGADESLPLRCLEACKDSLLFQMRVSSNADVALQLAKWKGADAELSLLIDPVLEILFAEECEMSAILPLLQGLAADCWPRAVLGEFQLDWHCVAGKAVSALAVSTACVESGDSDSAADVHAALAVWQSFAETVTEGVREPPVLMLAGMTGDVPPPEKRHRQRTPWLPSPAQIAQCGHLPRLFASFAQQVLESLRAPVAPFRDAFELLFEMRDSAEAAVASWVKVMNDSPAWQEACWTPLQRLCQSLSAPGAGEWLSEEVWREAEVILWFSTVIATRWEAASLSATAAILQLSSALDSAPQPWRSLLWCSACGLAARSGHQPTELVPWILQRSPFHAEAAELIEFLELPYARAVETACRQLPSAEVHAALGEQLLSLALMDRAAETIHSDTTEARSLFLQAMGHAMRGDPQLLCTGLSSPLALPKLRAAAEAEAACADSEWHALQALLSTLRAALPNQQDTGAPSEALWREHWQIVRVSLMELAPLSSSEQPLQAVCEALAAACRLPNLLPDAVTLLVQSACQDEAPSEQLKALLGIVTQAPCPPLASDACADLLAAAVTSVSEAIVVNGPVFLCNPDTVKAFFELLVAGLGGGPVGEALRPKLLGNSDMMRALVMLVAEALPDANMPSLSSAMLEFLLKLLSGVAIPAHTAVMSETSIVFVPGIVRALATQEHLAEFENAIKAGEALLALFELLPNDADDMLQFALDEATVPKWSHDPFRNHIKSYNEWPRKRDWLDYLLELVQEWQNEKRQKLI